MILWITFLGGAVGSFLNVVAYRLPLGISLLYPPSRCPGCETPIELRDNLPVIGWVLLKGRCRNCRISIPLRYPLIEAAAALIFLLVSYLELLSGGATLPVRPPNHYTGFVWIIWFTKWDLISIYLYHISLLSYLLTTAILIYDGNPPPRKLWIPFIAVGILAPILWPQIHPLPWSVSILQSLQGIPADSRWWWGAMSPLLGGLTGWILGKSLAPFIFNTTEDRVRRSGIPLSLGMSGIYLGWQAVVSIAILTLSLVGILYVARFAHSFHRHIRASAILAATLILLLTWRWWPIPPC